MRLLAIALVAGAFLACGVGGYVEMPPAVAEEVTPLPHPQFAEPELQAIATRLLERAQLRGIHSVRGRWNRVGSLIQLEAELDASPRLLEYVNAVAASAVRTDSGYFPSIRAQGLERCRGGEDEACLRARDLLERWYLHRLTIVIENLGDENRVFRYGGRHWEQYFHGFISRNPRDAATWGWIVSRHAAAAVRGSVGRTDGEAGYRYYLARTLLGTPHEARVVFSVPGVELRER